MYALLTEDQRSYQALVRDFMNREVKPHVAECDREGRFPTELYEKCFELGFHNLNIPEEYGGLGLDCTTVCVMYEEMGKVDTGFVDTLMSTAIVMDLVALGGNKAQMKRACELIVPGGYATFSMTEPNAGSDAGSVATTAQRKGDKYILNGRKCFATNAGYADFFVVCATTDKQLGTKGITAFFVEKGTPGLSVGKHEDKMGIRLANTCDVVLEDVEVPVENRVGDEGKGFYLAMKGLDTARVYNAAVAIGLSQGALDAAVQYSKERVQFGRPLYKHQAMLFKLADMDMRTELGRQLYMHAAALVDNGKSVTREAAMAKCYCADAAMSVTTDAVQVFGGYGYSREYPVEKMMRDAKIFQIFEGTNEIQHLVIGNQLFR